MIGPLSYAHASPTWIFLGNVLLKFGKTNKQNKNKNISYQWCDQGKRTRDWGCQNKTSNKSFWRVKPSKENGKYEMKSVAILQSYFWKVSLIWDIIILLSLVTETVLTSKTVNAVLVGTRSFPRKCHGEEQVED